MKKTTLIIMSFLIVLTIAISVPAKSCASCSDCKALITCYDRCRAIFADPLSQSSCYTGCLIGCWISADA